MDSFVVKEKKQSQLAVDITARDLERNCASGVLHTDSFDWLANGLIFPAEICVFLLQERIVLLFLEPIKQGGNLGRMKGAKEIRRAFEKEGRTLDKNKVSGAVLFRPGEVRMCVVQWDKIILGTIL